MMRKSLLVSCSVLALVIGARPSAEAGSITFAPAETWLKFELTVSGSPVLDPADELNTADGLNDTYELRLWLTTTTDYPTAGRYLRSISIDFGAALNDAVLDLASLGDWTDYRTGV